MGNPVPYEVTKSSDNNDLSPTYAVYLFVGYGDNNKLRTQSLVATGRIRHEMESMCNMKYQGLLVDGETTVNFSWFQVCVIRFNPQSNGTMRSDIVMSLGQMRKESKIVIAPKKQVSTPA